MDEPSPVLIIEDDPDVRLGCEQALQLEGFATSGFACAEDALKHIGADFPGVVVSDIRLPRMDGMALLRRIQQQDRELPVILITGHGDVALAVQAMKEGAHDFIAKPFAPEHLVEVVRRARDQRRLVLEVRELRDRLAGLEHMHARLIGDSAPMAQVRQLISRVAASAADILIYGETGTGKELAARCLHDASLRRNGNFVAINCGGLPENLFDSEIFGHEAGAFTGAAKRRIGKIEHASGGTLFLDEIEAMPVGMQVKLLRVLQERSLERLGSNLPIPVDCRVIAASKADLKQLSDAGQFRADLYYRLNVATLTLPSLRERREDIPLLFEHFLTQAAARHDTAIPAYDRSRLQTLMAYDWPGNVRELRNVADRFILGIESGIPPFTETSPASGVSLPQRVESFERALIAETLRRQEGHLGRSAEALGIPKTTLHDKIRKYGLSDDKPA